MKSHFLFIFFECLWFPSIWYIKVYSTLRVQNIIPNYAAMPFYFERKFLIKSSFLIIFLSVPPSPSIKMLILLYSTLYTCTKFCKSQFWTTKWFDILIIRWIILNFPLKYKITTYCFLHKNPLIQVTCIWTFLSTLIFPISSFRNIISHHKNAQIHNEWFY